jgi:hypothetical protein
MAFLYFAPFRKADDRIALIAAAKPSGKFFGEIVGFCTERAVKRCTYEANSGTALSHSFSDRITSIIARRLIARRTKLKLYC